MFLILIGLIFTKPLFAHPLDLGLLIIANDGGEEISVRLEMNPLIGSQLLGIDSFAFSEKPDPFKAGLFKKTLGMSNLKFNNSLCSWSDPKQLRVENSQLLSLTAFAECPHPSGKVTLSLPYLKQMQRSYRLMYVAKLNATEHVGDADPSHTVIEFTAGNASPTVGHFDGMGLSHIGVIPSEWRSGGGWRIPFGIDHILFVFALILSSGSLLNLMKMITGFTLGHTFSLALAAFGVFQVSGRWVEASIALTIAYVSFLAVCYRRPKHSWRVAIGIGLIHGLGFAAALGDLHLSLKGMLKAILGFNLGVEIGQMFIILILFPLVFYIRKNASEKMLVLRSASLGIGLVSFYWFIQRGFGPWLR